MTADVKMKFFGDSADAERALVALEKKYEKLEGQIKGVTRAGKRGSNDMSTALAGVATRALGAVAAYASIGTAVGKLIDESDRYIQRLERIKDLLPETELKLQIQGGLSDEEASRTRGIVQQQLLRTPSATLGEGIDLQRQLISSGFNAADVNSGAALGAVLDLKAATNQFGEGIDDPAAAVLSLSQFLKAQGREVNAQNVRSTGGKIAQIFEGSDIQFPDFSELAQVSATLTGLNLSENEQIAAFSTLVDTQGGANAKTQIRQFASRLRGAGASGQKVAALESLGLQPEDVDIIGESFTEALSRLGTAADSVDEGTRSSALLAIFGEKAQAGATELIARRGLVGERVGKLEGDAFERGVGLFQESTTAGRRRLDVRDDFATAAQLDRQQGVTFGDADNALNAVIAERMGRAGGAGARALISAEAAAVRGTLSGNSVLGLSPLEAARDAANLPGSIGDDLLKELRTIAGNTQPALNRNPQGE